MSIPYQTEFETKYNSGDNILVSIPKYCHIGEASRVAPENIIREYTIGKTDLNDCHGHVELIKRNGDITIVEYQWFNVELTGRKINLK
jgi:hypothetical protein|tara:strand:- start:6054 stop:6317 length:264 start_codon:yes stop_codon:yes gene_type:complete